MSQINAGESTGFVSLGMLPGLCSRRGWLSVPSLHPSFIDLFMCRAYLECAAPAIQINANLLGISLSVNERQGTPHPTAKAATASLAILHMANAFG